MPNGDNAENRVNILEKAIKEYEFTISKQVGALTQKFVMEIVTVVVIPIAAAVITYIFSSFAVALAPLTVGGVNAATKLTESKNILMSYFKDKSQLNIRVNFLRTNLYIAQQKDDLGDRKTELDKIANQLRTWTIQPA